MSRQQILFKKSLLSHVLLKRFLKNLINSTNDFIWEHEPTELLNHIANQYLEAQIQNLLFQSLYAEQAARFVSMDNATRNAENLLESTTLTYNKLRQAKITRIN